MSFMQLCLSIYNEISLIISIPSIFIKLKKILIIGYCFHKVKQITNSLKNN